ncbi:MAG: hypothetical protein QOJ91_777 [Sphingomonadales bacterium]|jgi:hypothetical protein|nr:hypothetical protein [Sphingomonadales bacterium]
MRGFAGLAVTGTMLVLASPAAALDRSAEGGEAKSFGAVPAHSRSRTLVPQIVALDSAAVPPAEDSLATRFRSLPVTENIAVGVGLFSVVGTTEKEQMRRRLDPAREFLGTSGTRVAAVGMSLRF